MNGDCIAAYHNAHHHHHHYCYGRAVVAAAAGASCTCTWNSLALLLACTLTLLTLKHWHWREVWRRCSLQCRLAVSPRQANHHSVQLATDQYNYTITLSLILCIKWRSRNLPLSAQSAARANSAQQRGYQLIN